ncbi:MAG: urease accessory protein UreF [Lachnospiraceae bacterium]
METNKPFLSLLQSVDAFFPIGTFTLSNGLEDYVLRDRIRTSEDLEEYLNGFLEIFPYNDLAAASLAYRHAKEEEFLLCLDATAAASKSVKEIRVGATRLCSRFLKAREAMKDLTPSLLWYQKQIQSDSAVGMYPIALGLYAADTKQEEETLLLLYGYSVLSSIVNNAVKLVPLSQLDGQRVLFESLEILQKKVKQAETITLEELGVSGACYELHCMNHAYLYSRQYMS